MKTYATVKPNFMNGEDPELRNLKVLFGIYAFYIIAAIIMPQYFGVHIGYDITCARLGNMLFIAYMLLNKTIFTHFFDMIFRCEVFVPLFLYLIVAGYTMVFRTDVNAFFLVFLEIFSFFMVIYGVRYVVGYKRAIKWVIGCAYFLGIYGLVEFVYGKSLFLQFLATVPTEVVNDYRSGHYRIMGPCGHPLGYGLVLLLFIAIACIDLKKDEIYLFKRPFLLMVLIANVFLTGSRSTLGIAMLELVILFLVSSRRNKLKSLFITIAFSVVLAIFLLFFHNTGLGRYILGQLASVVDQVLDTSFAAYFGVDVTTLANSENYRDALPYVFTLDWLNPWIGRGTRGFNGAEINGVYVYSIDNYYVCQYIKYAYPGMISYLLFMIIVLVVLVRDWIARKSAVTKAVLIGSVLYFLNLWWVDALQTLKFEYIMLAIFYASYLEYKDERRNLGLQG